MVIHRQNTHRGLRFGLSCTTFGLALGFCLAAVGTLQAQEAARSDPPQAPTSVASLQQNRDVWEKEPPNRPTISNVDEAQSERYSDSQPPPTIEEATTSIDPTASVDLTARVADGQPKDPISYKLWVIAPAVISILLAILFRQVIPALIIGTFCGAYMMVPCLPRDDSFVGLASLIAGFRLAAERYMMGAIIDPSDGYGHIKIIIFTLVIGFTVGVIGKNGGTRGMVNLVTGKSQSRRRGALTAWAAGLVVFFDDYANTMIVGPTMRSVFDRVKLSRAKLAYIVDSTAAPVASIALIGTWVGAEIGFIQSGLDTVSGTNTPAFLLDGDGNIISGMSAFIHSIAYRFYPILTLFMVFLIALTGRDFGPMKRSERRMLSRIDPNPDPVMTPISELVDIKPRWWLGLAPIATLVLVTLIVLVATGSEGSITNPAPPGASWWEKASNIISNGDSYLSIFYGALLSALAALGLTLFARACSLVDAVDAGLDGMNRMFVAIVILVLAWSLSSVLTDLKLGEVVAGQLRDCNFSIHWLPLAIFVTSAVIAFATGTSWGTMGILCPMTVTVTVQLAGNLDPTIALHLFYAAVGSVLAGAVFGDHCSPISDTTVLSSIASGCKHEEHVWTQLPYALTVAFVSMLLGDVLCSVYGWPSYLGLLAGAVLLVMIVFLIGRKPTEEFELAEGSM